MGIFLALDLILFFVFWELMLVPMYFLIQGWGSGKREFAAMKFFIYTAAGSAFLLASTIALAFIHQADAGFLTFDFRVLAAWNGLSGTTEVVLFLGLPRRVRDQGAAVPVPHVAAARAHRGADRGIGGAGRRDPEDGRVRPRAVLVRAVPAGRRRPRATAARARGDRHHLRRHRGDDADRLEARHRVLVGRAHGLRRARHLLAHHHRDRRRDVHDAQPPAHDGRVVPRGRHALRATAHARDQRVPRHLEVGAGARWPVPHRVVRRHRPARLLGLRRRVPVVAGRVPVRPALRDRGDVRRDPRRGVLAVGVPARVHRQAARRERQDARRHRARGDRGRAAARAEPVPRPLPEAGARPHRAHGEGQDRPARAEDRLPRAELRQDGQAAEGRRREGEKSEEKGEK